jgi:hypothetical protein
MSWSYVGLLAATSNEAFVRVGPLKRLAGEANSWPPLAVMAGILVLSGLVIWSRQK